MINQGSEMGKVTRSPRFRSSVMNAAGATLIARLFLTAATMDEKLSTQIAGTKSPVTGSIRPAAPRFEGIRSSHLSCATVVAHGKRIKSLQLSVFCFVSG